MARNKPKLSLITQFDDTVRFNNIQFDNGCEKNILKFLRNQSVICERWHQTLRENVALKEEIRKLKEEQETFENRIQHLKKRVLSEESEKLQIEKEKTYLEHQLTIIREVLLSDQNVFNDHIKEKMAFLETHLVYNNFEMSPQRLTTIEESQGSYLSLTDVSFDKTEGDNLERELYSKLKENSPNSKSKRIHPDAPNNIPKKSKLYDEEETTDDKDSSSSGADTTPGKCSRIRSLEFFSDPVPATAISLFQRQVCFSENDVIDNDFLFIDEPVTPTLRKSEPGNMILRRLSSAGNTNRNHTFCNKIIIRPENCYPCGNHIGFYKPALKCQDCRVVCHLECRDEVPLPCYSAIQTPTRAVTIADFAPMIPPLLVYCIGEIESRGLEEIGLYRVSGAKTAVWELKKKFLKGRKTPSLVGRDIHVVCGLVKEFLHSLPEPLITKILRSEFVKAARLSNEQSQFRAMQEVINKLPQANKDSLAFLVVHLKKVAKSHSCEMSIENLAEVFGPTIVGDVSSEPTGSEISAQTVIQCKIVHILLSLQLDFWNKFICIEDEVFHSPRTNVFSNRLGPIGGYDTMSNRSRGVALTKVVLSPRSTLDSHTKPKECFFSSRLLK